jgi:hypothetical protein
MLHKDNGVPRYSVSEVKPRIWVLRLVAVVTRLMT